MAEFPQKPAPSEEDEARAHCYALVSRLFYAPPDTDFVRRLTALARDQSAVTDATHDDCTVTDASAPVGYADAFLALQRAADSADLNSLRETYEELFIGAGAARVTPYTSAYALTIAPDRHLVALREQLAAWGLVRRDSVFEVEDHVSGICDAMRWLIESGHSLDEQRAFFDAYVRPGIGPLCEAVAINTDTPFYRAAAALTRAFLAIEKEGFELHGAE